MSRKSTAQFPLARAKKPFSFTNDTGKYRSFQDTMGSILGGSSNNGVLGQLGQDTQCCEKVVDPISMLATIAAIAAVSLYLRQAVRLLKYAHFFGS